MENHDLWTIIVILFTSQLSEKLKLDFETWECMLLKVILHGYLFLAFNKVSTVVHVINKLLEYGGCNVLILDELFEDDGCMW